MPPQTFVLKIPDAAIADLKNRLSLTRFPDADSGIRIPPSYPDDQIGGVNQPAGRLS